MYQVIREEYLVTVDNLYRAFKNSGLDKPLDLAMEKALEKAEKAREKAEAKAEANTLSRYIVDSLKERRDRKNSKEG